MAKGKALQRYAEKSTEIVRDTPGVIGAVVIVFSKTHVAVSADYSGELTAKQCFLDGIRVMCRAGMSKEKKSKHDRK